MKYFLTDNNSMHSKWFSLYKRWMHVFFILRMHGLHLWSSVFQHMMTSPLITYTSKDEIPGWIISPESRGTLLLHLQCTVALPVIVDILLPTCLAFVFVSLPSVWKSLCQPVWKKADQKVSNRSDASWYICWRAQQEAQDWMHMEMKLYFPCAVYSYLFSYSLHTVTCWLGRMRKAASQIPEIYFLRGKCSLVFLQQRVNCCLQSCYSKWVAA